MKYPRKWEVITNDQYAGCDRLKIHGGWLVVSWSTALDNECLVFVPDPKHEWELEESEPKKSNGTKTGTK